MRNNSLFLQMMPEVQRQQNSFFLFLLAIKESDGDVFKKSVTYTIKQNPLDSKRRQKTK
jgi:hypothetical protein